MRNLLRARNGHVIGLLRAYYVAHVTRYVVFPRNSLYYVHVIELVHAAASKANAFEDSHGRGLRISHFRPVHSGLKLYTLGGAFKDQRPNITQPRVKTYRQRGGCPLGTRTHTIYMLFDE